jgi:hypothetical protein
MSENSGKWHQRGGKTVVKQGGAGGFWFLGFIGALIYYLHFQSGTLWLVILAFIKAIFWPAFLVYHLYVFLRM